METCVVNLFSPGETVLVAVCGNFSARWAEIAEMYGVKVRRLEFPWGEAVDPERVKVELSAGPEPAGVLTVFSETSTGVVNDIEALGEIVSATKAVFVVDGISGVGALPFRMDAWKVDALAVGSQKGLLLPPGLAAVAVSGKARARIEGSRIPKFYFSLSKALAKAEEKKGQPDTPFTPPVTMIRQLNAALKLIEGEGLEAVWERAARLGEATRAAVKALGLRLLASRNPSDVVTAVDCEGGPDPDQIVKHLRDEFGISIIGGQGKLKGRIFRIGHVGYVDEVDVLGTIAALEIALSAQGRKVTLGSGVAAVQRMLLEARKSS